MPKKPVKQIKYRDHAAQVREAEPDMDDVSLEQVMQALSDPVRIAIVRLAADGPAQPCNSFFERIPKSTLSHHWKVLREAGLIRQERRGTQKLNSLRHEDFERRFPGLIAAVLYAAKLGRTHQS